MRTVLGSLFETMTLVHPCQQIIAKAYLETYMRYTYSNTTDTTELDPTKMLTVALVTYILQKRERCILYKGVSVEGVIVS